MSTTEFRLLQEDAKKLGCHIEMDEDNYTVYYDGAFLENKYAKRTFRYQDDIEAYLEEIEHRIIIYKRNLKLARIVGEIENGKLPALAWPGGYPIYYYTDDGSMLCPDCAEDDEEVVTGDVYYEGPEMECDGNCGKILKSAYGDPEEKE